MAHQTRPRTTRDKQAHPTRIAPSALDEMEAMVRHRGYRRSLPLWQSMFRKDFVDLTEEEERENNAPRTKFRLAAIMETHGQWLSGSIQQIREHGEAAWAFETVNGQFGDETNTITIPANLRIPGDLSPDAMLPIIGRYIRQQRQQLGIAATQHPRQHQVDKWEVCDLCEQGLNLWAITHRLFRLSGKTTYDSLAQAHYAKVRRAYRAACQLIAALNEQ